MPGQSRGEDYSIYILNTEGELLKTIQPQDMNFRPEENRERQERCGTREQPVRQTFMGWQGDATFEEEDFALDDLQDAQEQAYFNGEPVGDIEIIQNKYIPKKRATRTYRYYGVKFGFRQQVSGQKESATNQLEWQAKGRELV